MSGTTTNLGLVTPDLNDHVKDTIPALANNLSTLDQKIGPPSKLPSGIADLMSGVASNAAQLADIAININTIQRVSPEVDDTGRFSRALEKLPNGGALFIPAGTYVGYMDLPNSGITIYGTGYSSIIQLPNGANRDIIKGLSVSNISIFNLNFDGNADNNTTTETSDTGEVNKNDAIYLSKGDNYSIHHNYFKNTRGNAINLYTVTGVRIESNEIDTCNRIDQNGITVQFATTADKGSVISNNLIKNNSTGMGMSVFESTGLSVEGNSVYNCSVGFGFEWGSGKFTCVGNKSVACGKGAVITLRTDTGDKVDKGVISDNVFADCTGSTSGSVQMSGLRNVLFKNNQINGGSNDGVYASDLQDCTLEGNQISGMTGNGIYVISGTASKQLKISRNKVFANGTGTTGNGIYVNTGSEITIEGNECYNNHEQGIKVTGVTNLIAKDNVCYDNQATHTQSYGVWLGQNTTVFNVNNIAFGNLNSPQVYVATGGSNANTNVSSRWVYNNTSAYGKYVFTGNGASTVYIPHGLNMGYAPSWVEAQCADSTTGALGIDHVSCDATNLIITLKSASVNGTSYNFFWKAEY